MHEIRALLRYDADAYSHYIIWRDGTRTSIAQKLATKILDAVNAPQQDSPDLQARFDKLLEAAKELVELGSFMYRDGRVSTAPLLRVIEEVSDDQ